MIGVRKENTVKRWNSFSLHKMTEKIPLAAADANSCIF